MKKYLNKIIQGDCLKVMKEMPDNSVDLVLTDPPYGMEYHSNRYKGGNPHEDIVGDDSYPVDAIAEFKRVARKGVFSFCRWDNLKDVPQPKSFIVWVKNNHTAGDLEREFGRKWEGILFYPCKDFKFVKRVPDVFYSSRVSHTKLLHPTQKPLDILKYLIKNCSVPNDIIFDPFIGSGTTAVAAKQLNRNYIGIELNPDYCEIARDRLRQDNLF